MWMDRASWNKSKILLFLKEGNRHKIKRERSGDNLVQHALGTLQRFPHRKRLEMIVQFQVSSYGYKSLYNHKPTEEIELKFKNPELCDSGERSTRAQRYQDIACPLPTWIPSFPPPDANFPQGKSNPRKVLISSIFNLKVMCIQIQTVPQNLQNPPSDPDPQAPFPEAATVNVYYISSRNTLCIPSYKQIHAYPYM